jgi:hypothetical protein
MPAAAVDSARASMRHCPPQSFRFERPLMPPAPFRRLQTLLVVTLLAAPSLFAATFTVTSGADSGPGTLRQAILDANTTAARDQIVLATDVAVTSSLPAITAPIDITGAKLPSGRYRIDAGVLLPGLVRLNFAAGSDGSTVDSIYFGMLEAAIRIAASNVVVTNTVVDQSRIDVFGNNTVIGGGPEADRNDIFLLNVNGDVTRIFGNTIDNLRVLGAENTRIGGAPGGNTIGSAILQDAFAASILDNTIGSLSISQSAPGPGPGIVGNTIDSDGTAIRLVGLSSAIIDFNVIRGTTGIEIIDSTSVEIINNSIVATGLAIDLGGDGVTPNDPAPDADIGANSLQNYPVLTSATLTPGSLLVRGTLSSAPLTPYRIEIFGNDAANPDARTLLNFFDLVTDETGNATFEQNIGSPLPVAGEVITATATNRGPLVPIPGSTGNSTSEVSAPIAIALPGGLGFETSAQSVDEAAGTVTIAVTRTGGSEGTVTVNYATSNGTAAAPGDYTSTSGTLTFGPGVTEQSIVVPIVNDALAEDDETFTVTLSGPTGGSTLGQSTTTITILDTDPAVAAAPIPTASTWALIAMALSLAFVALRR